MRTESSRSFISNVDWVLVVIYFLLTICGLLFIFSALYNNEVGGMPDRFTNQIIWFAVSIMTAIVILLMDSKYFFLYSYFAYFPMLLLMVGVALFGKEVKGARSWIAVGGFSLQPVEFMKIATALALSRYMSSYSFDMRNLKDFAITIAIIGAPMFVVIFVQNDTGSALVFGSFVLMLYREGLNKLIYVVVITMIAVFVAYFLVQPFFVIAFLIVLTVFGNAFIYGDYLSKFKYVVILFAIYFILHFFFIVEGDDPIRSGVLLLIAFVATFPIIFIYMRVSAGGYRMLSYVLYIAMTTGFYFSVNYVFNNVMQLHQRKRILDLLGIESDLFGWGYNVNQSKIAIGSGGFSGKGFLHGTQTKFNFVPEQSTDFIFCTVGEEFGFIGTFLVILLFAVLIFRLMHLGDKLTDSFSRIYCYSVASIFFFHVVVNVGMTIGLVPVIGIPLPFFSYGGSSLLAFTVMLSIALKLNMDNFEKN